MKKVIIAGGRDFKDRSRMASEMDTILSEEDTVICGMAEGGGCSWLGHRKGMGIPGYGIPRRLERSWQGCWADS